MSDNYCSCENQDVHANCCKVKRLEATLASREAEIEKLQSDLRGYNAMMADRGRLLEENFELKEALKVISKSCYSGGVEWARARAEEVLLGKRKDATTSFNHNNERPKTNPPKPLKTRK